MSPRLSFVPLVLGATLLCGCADRAEPPPLDADEALREGIALLEQERTADAAKHIEAVFHQVGEGGPQPDEAATLRRLQELLMPLGPDVASPMMLVNTTIALAAATDLMGARTPLATWVESHPDSYSALLALGHLAMKFDFRDAGVLWFERAHEAAPTRAEASLSLGATYAEAGRVDDALAAFGRVLETQPEQASALSGRARLMEKLGRSDDAIADWRRVAEIDHGALGARAHNQLGAILNRQGANEDALAEFRTAAELAPDSPIYEFNVAQLLHLLNRPDEAKPHLERAAALRDDDPRPLFLLGQIADDAGDDATAERRYRDALRRAPDHESSRYRLSLLLRRTGRAEEADRLVGEGGS